MICLLEISHAGATSVFDETRSYSCPEPPFTAAVRAGHTGVSRDGGQLGLGCFRVSDHGSPRSSQLMVRFKTPRFSGVQRAMPTTAP